MTVRGREESYEPRNHDFGTKWTRALFKASQSLSQNGLESVKVFLFLYVGIPT